MPNMPMPTSSIIPVLMIRPRYQIGLFFPGRPLERSKELQQNVTGNASREGIGRIIFPTMTPGQPPEPDRKTLDECAFTLGLLLDNRSALVAMLATDGRH